MKKIILLIFLILCLSINVFAEGKGTAGLPNRPMGKVSGAIQNNEQYQSVSLIKMTVNGDTMVYAIPIYNANNGSGIVSGDTFYTILLSDSTTFIRGGIPGDATAITECSIDKVDPISKNIVWKEEYDFVYDVNNNLIGIHLKK